MRKLQSQGVHHITLVGADRQTSIDFWEGVLGMPFVFEQPNLDNAGREPPLLRSGRRPADHDLHQRGAHAATRSARRPTPAASTTWRSRSPRRRSGQAVERLDERGIKHSGVKDRGFMDSIYFTDPLGLLIELASYRFEPPPASPTPTSCWRPTSCASTRGDHNIARSTSPTRSRPRRPLARVAVGRPLPEEPVLSLAPPARARARSGPTGGSGLGLSPCGSAASRAERRRATCPRSRAER